MGNAIVQGIGVGAIADLKQARQIVKNSFDIETYTPQDSDEWDAAYEQWKKIIGA